MWIDPIVEEVRETGDKLAKAVDYDLHRFCERIREYEQQHPERLVSLPPRHIEKAVTIQTDVEPTK